MPKNNIFQQQFDTIKELVKINEEEHITVKDVLPLLSFLCLIAIEDWNSYTTVDKIVFIVIWSPLIHLFLHF